MLCNFCNLYMWAKSPVISLSKGGDEQIQHTQMLAPGLMEAILTVKIIILSGKKFSCPEDNKKGSSDLKVVNGEILWIRC